MTLPDPTWPRRRVERVVAELRVQARAAGAGRAAAGAARAADDRLRAVRRVLAGRPQAG